MKPTHHQINRWIREQEARLGIGASETPAIGVSVPTVTVYPGPLAMERLAHFGADRLIANNPAYDAMCSRTDAMLAEIIKGYETDSLPLRRGKSTK